MTGFLSSIGWVGLVLARASFYFPAAVLRKRSRRDFIDRLYASGISTLPVITVVSLFTGMILSLQVGIELSRFNQELYLGAAVMISLIREMGPFSCGICLAACVGSAIAAEIGTMKVNDEIDALEVMNIPPMRFLAAPRILALVVMAPLLAFYCCVVGTIGGGVVAATQLNVDFGQYMSGAMSIATVKDLFTGLVKALVFGYIIGAVSVAEGLRTTCGALGVGRATQRAVIVSFLAILISGYMITRLCYR